MNSMHASAIVIDGLLNARWSRTVFEDMRKGGLTAANCTVSAREDFKGTVHDIARLKSLIRQNTDLLMLVRSTRDIEQAKLERKTGIILGVQNASAFEDYLGHIEAFADMGVRVAQLCGNGHNPIDAGGYERDSGLSGHGHDVIAEMNRVGIMVDLSLAGPRTSEAAVRVSKKPVTYTHCLPAGLQCHPGGKSDEQLRFIADHGGFIGVGMFTPVLHHGRGAAVEDYVKTLDHVIDLVGDDCVGVGTGYTQDRQLERFDHATLSEKQRHGLATAGLAPCPVSIRSISEMSRLTAALERAGWSWRRIEKVLGGNWLRVFKQAWGR